MVCMGKYLKNFMYWFFHFNFVHFFSSLFPFPLHIFRQNSKVQKKYSKKEKRAEWKWGKFFSSCCAQKIIHTLRVSVSVCPSLNFCHDIILGIFHNFHSLQCEHMMLLNVWYLHRFLIFLLHLREIESLIWFRKN